jgi:palmitoyl-protein thioesterase
MHCVSWSVNQTAFLAGSHYLANINNEKEEKNPDALTSLDNFVLVKWISDTSIIPSESSHFGFYNLGQDNTTLSLQELPMYMHDWVGLKEMDMEGRLHFKEMEGDHMDFNWAWFSENIVIPF